MITVAPGASYEATLELGVTGLVGILTVATYDGDTATQTLTTTGINEIGVSGVYVATLTAPATAGQYVVLWSEDGTLDPDKVSTDDLLVTFSRQVAGSPSGRDLCTLDDVLDLVPGYRQNDTVEAKLQQLITDESELIQDVREIVPALDQPEERDFDIGYYDQQSGEIAVGDIATTDDMEIEIRTADGVTVRTIDVADIVPLYRFGRRQPRASWEPIVALRFQRYLTANRVLHITATFGFPTIPPYIRQATAKRVLLRYVSDVAASQITDAIDNLNLAAMFASARDAIESLDDGVYIA